MATGTVSQTRDPSASAAGATGVSQHDQFERRVRGIRRGLTPYLFILPFAVMFTIFFLLPIGYALTQSFYRSKRSGLGLGAPTISFTGFDNYIKVFHDANFYAGVGRVLLYGVVQVPVMLVLALVFALMLDSAMIRFRSFFRLAFFLPYAVPGIVAAILWGFLYYPSLSPIVRGLHDLHLQAPDFLGSNSVLWSMANISTWEYTGYNMIIIFAALQAIPPQIYESARLDGCSEVGVARHIKIPLVGPALVLAGIFSIIGTFQLYNEPVVLSTISNNVSTTYTPNLYAYTLAFGESNYYYAAALAVVLAVVTFVLSFSFLRLTQRHSGV